MRFITTFAPYLYSVLYQKDDFRSLNVPVCGVNCKKDELNRLFELWTDVVYLRDFYLQNTTCFKDSYWKGVTLDDFVLDVVRSVPLMLKEIGSLCSKGRLDDIFQSLVDRKCRINNIKLLEVKSKHGSIKGRFAIRLYAIKLEENCYLITGGALKITKKMISQKDTEIELRKMTYVRSYLEREYVFDLDSFNDIKNESYEI